MQSETPPADTITNVLNACQDAVIGIDARYRIHMFNEAAERIFGYPAADIMGEMVDILIPERCRSAQQQKMSESIPPAGILGQIDTGKEFPGIRRSAEEFPASATITDVLHEGKTLQVIVLQDLTQRYQLEESRQLAEYACRLASVGVMAGGITHEITQPLTALKFNIATTMYWINQNPGLAPTFLEAKLERMVDDIARMEEIIKYMRSFWQAPDEKLQTRIHLHQSVENALSLLERQLGAHGISVSRDMPQVPVSVLGNPTHIEQIIINLVVNSMNALDHIGIADKVIRIRVSREDDKAVLEVSDNGPGLPEDFSDQLFAPFYTTSRPGKGMGLGLAIVKHFVQDHKGTVTARNRASGGASFVIRFPIMSHQGELFDAHSSGGR